MVHLPTHVCELLELIEACPAPPVVPGGSRALDSIDADRDWDLGLSYRGAIDLDALAAHGAVHLPGAFTGALGAQGEEGGSPPRAHAAVAPVRRASNCLVNDRRQQ